MAGHSSAVNPGFVLFVAPIRVYSRAFAVPSLCLLRLPPTGLGCIGLPVYTLALPVRLSDAVAWIKRSEVDRFQDRVRGRSGDEPKRGYNGLEQPA
jgi:hypothetical protein